MAKTTSFTTPGNDYSVETGQIERRRSLAKALQQQSMLEIPQQTAGGWVTPTSPLQIASKLAQAFAANRIQSKSDSQQQQLGNKYQSALAETLMKAQQAGAGSPGSPMPPQELGGGPAQPSVPPDRQAMARILMGHPGTQQLGMQQMTQDMAPPQRVDLGDKIGLINQQGQIVGSIPKGATPDAMMRRDTTMQTHATPSGSAILGAQTSAQNHLTPSGSALLGDARAREQMERDKFGTPMEVSGPNGPMLAMQNKNTGTMVDVNSRLPAGQIGPKIGESAQKQQTGVANTQAAIGEYRDALKKFTVTDLANPAARARMGTVYNNMLLQAKEAYNLGVLNGPDYMILQEVITNPASMTGALTSKKALDDQARKLDEIMSKIGGTVSQVQSGIQPNRRSSDDPLGLRQ